MAYAIQSVFPVIKLYNSQSAAFVQYQTFSCDCASSSGKTLESYSFQKSINNLAGSFTFSVKELTNIPATKNYKTFYDRVHPLDVVEIIENNQTVFIGVVTNKSFTAIAAGLQKTVNISGKSIDYLFSYLNINFNVTAMAYANKSINQEILNLNSNWKMNNGKNPCSISDFVNQAYSLFCEVAKDNTALSNVRIIDIIKHWYGDKPFDVSGIKFLYPISSNLFGQDVVDFISYIKNLLPSNAYECFGTINKNKPVIKIRECPFDGRVLGNIYDNRTHVIIGKGWVAGDWYNLASTDIDPSILTDYTLTQSIDEVYTGFYSFIEGSAFDPSFYENLQAIQNDLNSTSAYPYINKEKRALYGYKPLRVNFVGFNTTVADDENVKNDLNEKLKKLNERIAKWYGNLDTMYNASISVVLLKEGKYSTIGQKVNFLGGEFYVTGVQHTWKYGSSTKISYSCERGGSYNRFGDYSELKNVSKQMAELKKWK